MAKDPFLAIAPELARDSGQTTLLYLDAGAAELAATSLGLPFFLGGTTEI